MKKMRKTVLVILILAAFALSGCGAEAKNPDPQALIGNYLTAVQNNDYEAIWSMVPEKIREYAIEQGIIEDKEDGLDYICFAVYDYYWLDAIDLPACESFAFEITEEYEEDASSLQKYLAKHKIRLDVEEARWVGCTVTAEERTQECSFYLIKTAGEWGMVSVVGDDELFEY